MTLFLRRYRPRLHKLVLLSYILIFGKRIENWALSGAVVTSQLSFHEQVKSFLLPRWEYGAVVIYMATVVYSKPIEWFV